jgi:hypothetical protein
MIVEQAYADTLPELGRIRPVDIPGQLSFGS